LSSAADMADSSNDVSDPQPTAQFVFESIGQSQGGEEDYHKTINGELYIAWVRNRLLPAFNKKFPGKKMILVLDNASYHRVRSPDALRPKEMDADSCLSYLESCDLPIPTP